MRLRLLAASAMIVVALAGCGEKDKGTDNAKSDQQKEREQVIKFVECMRDQGIDMPDPEFSDDGIQLMMPKGAVVDEEQMEAAQQECKKYMPNNGEPPKMSKEDREKALQFAECMRENGVPEFPDPTDGGFGIQGEPGSGLDPESESFQAAEEACEKYSPGRGEKKNSKEEG